MTLTWNREWPLLTDYGGRRLARVALPLGGIGTGTVSLGGRGNLQDWEIMNTPALGYNGGHAVFILWTRPQGGEASARALEGALQPPYEGQSGSTAAYHGLPRFRECAFGAAYPLGQVLLSDPTCPLDVRLEAFNPLVPGDPDTSGIPMAALRYVLHNPSALPVEASITGYMRNMIGADGRAGRCQGNRTAYRQSQAVRGLWMTSEGVLADAPQWGTIALTTDGPDLSYCTGSEERSWGGRLLALWDDIMDDGRLDERQGAASDAPFSGLCSSVVVPPASEVTVTFLLTWVFPNRPAWSRTPVAPEACECCGPEARVGNYYATQYVYAWDVAERVMPRLPALERQTLVFLDAFCASDLPAVVKEAALYNVSTLRTQTCFRTEDGRFYGWEGCCDDHGCCMGSCTHVWNYEQATAFLFGSLARSMREIEFLHATNDDGRMSFRVSLPLGCDAEFPVAAADGQMGCILKAYREWQLLGDDAWLRTLWPQVKRALAYAWVPGGWDADQDGVMEGCQHNTLDVSGPTRRCRDGTWAPCAPPKRWPGMSAMHPLPPSAPASSSMAAPGWTKNFSTGSTTSTTSNRRRIKIPWPPACRWAAAPRTSPSRTTSSAPAAWWISWWASCWRMCADWGTCTRRPKCAGPCAVFTGTTAAPVCARISTACALTPWAMKPRC